MEKSLQGGNIHYHLLESQIIKQMQKLFNEQRARQ